MSRTDHFGIYIQTWPGDFHLCQALIASIRHWHPDVPITLIPGDHFHPSDHPFREVDILPVPDGFLGTLGHADRCFWSWFGPYEKFLYLDADMVCLRSLEKGIQRIRESGDDEVFAHIYAEPEEWRAALEDPGHVRHQECVDWLGHGLGTEKNMARFDPDWDFRNRCPVPSGVWGGTRGQMSVELIQNLNERETRFYEEELKRPFLWDKGMVFYIDQGRFNYLIDHAGLQLINLVPDLHDRWGGEADSISMQDVENGSLPWAFMHWAGVPRPSPSFDCSGPRFRRFAEQWDDGVVTRDWLKLDEIPAYGVWRRFYEESGGDMSVMNRVRYTLRSRKSMKKKLGRHRP